MTDTAQARMEAVIAERPNIGRVRLVCDLAPEYLNENVANWQHGFSVVTFEKEGHQFLRSDRTHY